MHRFLIVVVLLLAAACSKKSEAPSPTPAPEHAASTAKPAIDPASARTLIAQGAVVLDVRTPDEFDGGHLAGATNVAVAELPQRLAEVDTLVGGDKTRPVVVYCAAGGRAAKAKTALEAAGYTHVVNGGGYDDLK